MTKFKTIFCFDNNILNFYMKIYLMEIFNLSVSLVLTLIDEKIQQGILYSLGQDFDSSFDK